VAAWAAELTATVERAARVKAAKCLERMRFLPKDRGD
jgi:hypothetical protein